VQALDIDVPWPLQAAQAEISSNTMAAAAGIALPDSPPLLHFAKRLVVYSWSAEPGESP
jgi:hypothetical protein